MTEILKPVVTRSIVKALLGHAHVCLRRAFFADVASCLYCRRVFSRHIC